MKLPSKKTASSRKRLACAVAVALMLGGCSQKTSEEHLASAQAFIQANDQQAAVVELKNAIQLDPQAPAPRFELGKLYLDMNDYSGAEKELSRAMELGHPASEVVPLLSRAYQRTGSVNAMAEVNHQLEQLSNAEQIEVGFYKLQSLIELEQNQEARLLIEELQALETSSIYAGLVRGMEHILNEQNEQALAIVQEMRDKAPLNRDALLMLARLHLQMQDVDTAIEAFKDYLSKHGDDNNTKFLVAGILVENQRPQEAEPYVEDLLALSPDNPMLNQLKGIILSDKGEFEKAYEHLTKAIDAGRTDPVLRLVAGYSAFQQGDYEAANMHLSVIAGQLPDDHAGLKLLAASQLQLGLSDDAQSSLQRLRTESGDDASLYSRAGYELLRQGNVADAQAMLERTEQLGDDADDLLRLGVLQLSLNNIEGLINLEAAVAQAPESTTAQSTLATAYLASGQLDKAAKLADDWKRVSPNSVEPYMLAAELAMRNQDAAAAQAQYEQALAMQPESTMVLLAQANFLMRQEQVEGARQNIDAVLTREPENLSALALLYMAQRAQGDVSDVISRVGALLEQSNSNEVIRILLARMYATEQDNEQALELLSRISPDRQTPRDFWVLKGRTLLQANQLSEAETHYQQWVELFPYDKDAALGKLLMLDLSGDARSAIEVIERFLEKRDDTQIRLLQAHFHSLTGDVAKSREALAILPEGISDNPFVLSAVARNFLTEGKFAEAIEPAKAAYAANQNLRNLVATIASYEGAQQADKAFELLNQHTEAFPDDLRARMLLAERKIQRDSGAAMQEYAALVAANDDNYVALNNLAYLLLQEGDVETAQTYAERAVELQPNNAATADTLAQVYRAQSKFDEALALYERTVDDNMRNEEIFLNYIEVLLEAEKTTIAQRRLAQRTFSLPESQQKLEELKAKFNI